MVKVTNIKTNQSMPISNNIGTSTNNATTANRVPNVENNRSTNPLWKDIINAIPSYTKEDVANASKTAKTPMWVFNDLTPEVRPENAVEETAWGWNYGLDRAVSQQDNQQWHYNALNGTWHVVGMPENQGTSLNVPSNQKWKRRPWVPWVLPEEDTPSEQVVTQTPSATPTAKNTTKQTGVSQQNTQTQEQSQERIVTPREFWWWNQSIEEAEQTVAANEEAIADMEADLNKSTAGELYGKVTADKNAAIKTLEDENSVYKSMNEARIASFKQLQTMDNGSIAAAIVWGVMATDSQQMRDLMQYDPAKYNEVQNQVKALRWQMNINAIASWSGDYNTVATNWSSSLANEKANFATSNSNLTTTTADILKNVNQSLSSNVNASSASETMASIENDMATLQNRMKNLKKEANQIFKWDVPQYIVNAYVANRTAEIQDQLSILENRYNAAYSRYQTEWEQTKWQAEYQLKKEELDIKRQTANIDNWATQQGVMINWAKLAWTTWGSSTWLSWNSVPTTSLSREQISSSIDDLVNACNNWQLGNAQCAAWIQKYYLPTLGVSLWTLSKYSEKQAICNEDKSYTPQKWDIVVMSSTSAPENWHMGIVVWVEWDKLTYLDWNGTVQNGTWTETAWIHTTKLSSSSIYGYYNPTKQSEPVWTTYNPDLATIYADLLQKWIPAWTKQASTLAALWLNSKDPDAWTKAFAQANARKEDTKDDSEVLARMRAVESLFGLTGKENRRWRQADTSFMWPVLSIFSEESWDFRTNYNFIKDNITFEKLLDLKRNWATFWALSDNELRAIWNAAARLSTLQSTEDFYADLLIIYNWFRKAIWEPSITLESAKAWNFATQQEITDEMMAEIFS